jgi:hypothetical protein
MRWHQPSFTVATLDDRILLAKDDLNKRRLFSPLYHVSSLINIIFSIFNWFSLIARADIRDNTLYHLYILSSLDDMSCL